MECCIPGWSSYISCTLVAVLLSYALIDLAFIVSIDIVDVSITTGHSENFSSELPMSLICKTLLSIQK